MPKRPQRIATEPAIRPRYWYAGGSTAEWLGALRDFLLEHRDVNVRIDEQTCEALHDLERESRSWLYNVKPLLDFRLWDVPRLRARDSALPQPRISSRLE